MNHRTGPASPFDLFCVRWYPAALIACGALLLISTLF